MTESHTVQRHYGPSGLPFTHLLPSDPSLSVLRSRENLDEVVEGADDTFERALALKSWVGQQWKFGPPDPYPPWRATDVLDWIRSGRTSGHCGQYAMVFLQACLSFGIQARYVEVGQTTNPYSHFTTEVYLSGHGKWAILDATAKPHLASHYLVGGVPQSALELHRALLAEKADGVEVIHDVSVVEGGEERTFGTAVQNYYYFRIFFRQDQGVRQPRFRNPDDTADRYIDAVEWIDEKTVPWEKTELEVRFPLVRLTERRTGDEKDLYWRPKLED